MKSKTLSAFGEELTLLDTFCSAPVTNLGDLMTEYKNNNSNDVITLGGNYKSPYTGTSELFHEIDYDPNLGMTILNLKFLEDNGNKVDKINSNLYRVKFKL